MYAIRYNQRERNENVAVILPGNMIFDLRHNFCGNLIGF